MATESWTKEELEWELIPDLKKWPTFSDENRPLKPDEVPGMAPPKVVLTLISNRLRSLYREAKQSDGINYSDWAQRCGKKDRQTPKRWIDNPATMNADDVENTCELFGVTVEYLRGGTSWKGTTGKIWDGEQVQALYDSFSDRHKELVTSVVRECLMTEWAYKNMRDMMGAIRNLAECEERMDEEHN